MKLPSAVREAAKRSNELSDQIRQEAIDRMNAVQAPVHVHSDPLQGQEPVVTQAPEPVVEQPPQDSQSVTIEPAQTPKTETAEYWEHRFKTLEGISNAERKRMKEKVTKQEEDMDLMRQQLRDLQKAQREAKANISANDLLSDDEKEKFSEDTVNLIVKVAKKIAADSTTNIREDFEERVNTVEREAKETKEDIKARQEQGFWNNLDAAIPDWKAVNKDIKFLRWVTTPDPVTGQTYDELLQECQGNLDHKTVIAIFKAFKSSNPGSTVPSRQETRVTPEPVGSAPQGNNQGQDTGLLQPEEIRKFYRDVTQGKYKNRKLEADAIRKRIDRQVGLA